jgi:hypothetical protein
MKVIIRLIGLVLASGAISVSNRFKEQRLEVILLQSNSSQLIVARPAKFPYADLT